MGPAQLTYSSYLEGEVLSCRPGIVGDEDAKESGALPGPYKPVPGARLINLMITGGRSCSQTCLFHDHISEYFCSPSALLRPGTSLTDDYRGYQHHPAAFSCGCKSGVIA